MSQFMQRHPTVISLVAVAFAIATIIGTRGVIA